MKGEVTIGQIDNTIRTYKEALERNPLTEKERKKCYEKIKELEKMKRRLRNK